MRRYARTLIIIAVLVTIAVLSLGFQTFKIGNFERGDDTLLGLKLGLDLQGGSHLVFRAASETPPTADDMEGLRRILERRVNSGGLGEPIIQLVGEDRILIQLPGIGDPGRAKSLIGETARLEFKHRTINVPRDLENITSEDMVSVKLLALTQGADGLATTTIPTPDALSGPAASTGEAPAGEDAETTTATSTAAAPIDENVIPALAIEFTEDGAREFAEVVDRLAESIQPLKGTGVVYPNALTVSASGDPLASLEVPYFLFVRSPEQGVIPLGGEPLVQRLGTSTSYWIILAGAVANFAEAEERFGPEPEVTLGEILGKMDEDVGLTGDDLARAYPGQHQGSGMPIVNIEFNGEGTRKFGEITTLIAGTPDLLAIVLDDEELIAPTVNQAITGGAAFIQGRDFTIDRVRDIALLLEGGRLPIPIELIEERDVDAILGADSLAKSVAAGGVGLLLVLLFMVLYYRVPGLVAAAALLVYASLVLAIFKLLPVTLTLSGVAAAILSIGMAVDANILIFERMKEELRAGRTLLSSTNIGFNRAWPAIRDSNVSTLITCAILFWFADTLGATIVQGFAATLAIGVGVSMFSAITVSRTFLRVVAATALNRQLGWFVPVGGGNLPQRQPGAQTA